MRREIARIFEPRANPLRAGFRRDFVEIRREILGRAGLGGNEVRVVSDRRADLIWLDRMAAFATDRLEQSLALFDERRVRERPCSVGGSGCAVSHSSQFLAELDRIYAAICVACSRVNMKFGIRVCGRTDADR